MFVDEGDLLLLPDQLWGNYQLIFGVKRGAKIGTLSAARPRAAASTSTGFARPRRSTRVAGKLIVLFNFPNNPTGYSITAAEADAIRDILVETRRGRLRHRGRLRRRLLRPLLRRRGAEGVALHAAGRRSRAHPGHQARRRLQGGLRLGPARGLHHLRRSRVEPGAYEALEKKTGGCIRGTISNSPNLSQALVLRAMADPELQGAEGREVRHPRASGRPRSARCWPSPSSPQAWTPYPFNSGYFICREDEGLDAEAVPGEAAERLRGGSHLHQRHRYPRRPSPAWTRRDIADLFDVMLECALEMRKG